MSFLDFLKKDKKTRKRVKVKNLVVKRGSNVIIDGLSFSVNRGQIYGLIGMSGSGKSTVMKSILGLYNHKGSVDFNDSYGYCPQEDAFFEELSVKENLKLFGGMNGLTEKESLKQGKKLFKELLMSDRFGGTSQGLSGGQRKRFNIILSILHNPQIIFLDEPFAGLDYYNRMVLWRFLKKLKNKSKTVIITTHLLSEAQDYCSEILLLKNGKKFAAGSPKQVISRRGLEVVVSLKTDYLNQDIQRDIKSYVAKRKINLLELEKKRLMFISTSENKDNFYDFLKRRDISFSEDFVKKPDLEDLFLLSVVKK